MHCDDYLELISKAMDGELTQEEQAELDSHLAVCQHCRGLYEAYREIDLAIGQEVEVPAGLTSAVMTAIRCEKEKRSPLGILKRYRFTAIAACAAIAIMIAGGSLSRSQEASVGEVVTSEETTTIMEKSNFTAVAAEEPITMEETEQPFAAYDGGGLSEDIYVELSEHGYSGILLVITQDRAELVSSLKMISLPSGNVVYCASAEAISEIHQGEYEELLLPGDDQETTYIMIE